MAHSISSASERETRRIAAGLAQRLKAGDLLLLQGDLGAGKTTFVRGFLEGLGYQGPVRSPSFNLIQTFATTPPVMHADLYRLESEKGIGIEEYLDDHICLVEWPERAADLMETAIAWRIRIEFDGEGRKIEIATPS